MSTPTPSPEVMKNTEIGQAVVAHVNAGNLSDESLWDAHWHPDFESVEADGMSFKGRPAVAAKCAEWMGAHTVHSCKATGPFVGARGFSVQYELDVEPKDGSWPRMTMRETAIYTVDAGKVVREEFWYAPMPG